MVKVLALLFIIILAVASLAGYLYLDSKITSGKEQIATGQIQLEKGQATLEEGKARLEAGKQELSAGKEEYERAEDNLLLVFADKVFKGGKNFREAREQISDGDRQVAKGEDKVVSGEKRIDAGELKLQRGREQLGLARDLRIACGIGAVLFTVLSIMLGFWWRRSLARIFRHG